MTEVNRSRQLLREEIRYQIMFMDLSEHTNSSSIGNCHVKVMPWFDG